MRQVCFGRPDSSSFVERVPQAVAGARGGQWPADPVPGQWPQASCSSWPCHPPGSPQDPPRIPAPHRPVPCAGGCSRRGWAQAGPGRTQNSLEFSPFRHLQSNTTGNNLGTLLDEMSCGMLFPSIPGDHPDLPLDLHWVKPVCPITVTLLLGQQVLLQPRNAETSPTTSQGKWRRGVAGSEAPSMSPSTSSAGCTESSCGGTDPRGGKGKHEAACFPNKPQGALEPKANTQMY